ncbi:hypothetical protein BHM03_00026633, partial [Ensete ventricosum]
QATCWPCLNIRHRGRSLLALTMIEKAIMVSRSPGPKEETTNCITYFIIQSFSPIMPWLMCIVFLVAKGEEEGRVALERASEALPSCGRSRGVIVQFMELARLVCFAFKYAEQAFAGPGPCALGRSLHSFFGTERSWSR